MRLKSIDFLRFIAVILVIIRHFNYTNVELNGNLFYDLFLNVVSFGWIGVDLFFVISGFLVSGLLFNKFDETKSFGEIHFFDYGTVYFG